MIEEIYEYELIDIIWNLNYDYNEEETSLMVHEDEFIVDSTEDCNRDMDADGIALGSSNEDIKQRKVIISEFWRRLRTKYPDPELFKVHNLALDEDIYLRAVSLDEALSHSAVSYLSTKAFLRVEDVLVNARPVGRVEPKIDTANQNNFEKLLIMTYEYDDIGRVKLTVGLRRKKKKEEVQQKVEYAITHLQDGTPLIQHERKGKKKASHRK